MDLAILIGVFSAGIAAGILGGLMGIGGGMILIPVLTLGFGYSTQEAVGVSLIAVIASSIAVVGITSREGLPHLRLAMLLEPCAILFGAVGGYVGAGLDSGILSRYFAVFAASIAVLFIVQILKSWRVEKRLLDSKAPGRQIDSIGTAQAGSRLTDVQQKDTERVWRWSYWDSRQKRQISYTPKRPGSLIGVMSVAGFLAGLLGIGGGALVVPAFHLISGIPMLPATATSSYMMAMSGAGGALYYAISGTLNWQLAAWVNLGVILGALFSRKISRFVSGQNLKLGFSFLLIFVAIRMWLR